MSSGEEGAGKLFVVATPIGNLADVSSRALDVLRTVAVIACEDTRHSGRLLKHFQIKARLVSYHEHNEETRSRQIVARLQQGDDVALIADAGTPLISDPGFRLVKQCRAARISVVPIPGATAIIAALSVSGLATDRFYFAGFLSRKAPALRRELEEISKIETTVVCYLSPHRIESTLETMLEVLGNRPVLLAREMTKIHEEFLFGTLQEVASQIRDKAGRGEYTLVVGPGERSPETAASINAVAYVTGLEKVEGLSRPDAIRRAAEDLKLRRNQVYQAVVNSDYPE